MKILIVISNMFGGGAQRVVSRLANSLSEENDVEILTFPTPSTYYLNSRIRVFHLHEPELHFNGFNGFKIAGIASFFGIRRVFSLSRQLKKLKQTEKPDVTVSFLDYPNLMNALAGGGGGKIMSERNNPKNKGKLYFWTEAISFCFADKVVFQTETVKNMYPFWIRKKGVVIPNPVKVEVEACGGSHRIVTMGRLHPQKNHELLIRAFNKFSQTHPLHTLHIYGKNYGDRRLDLLIESMGLSGKVFLEGFVDDIHEAVADAEQFVLSSDYEGTPNALLEAMMMGLPCLSTEFEGIREMLGGSEACLLVPVGDENLLAEAMSSLADDDAARRKLSEMGKRFAAGFSLDRVLPMWYDTMRRKGYSYSFITLFSFFVRVVNKLHDTMNKIGIHFVLNNTLRSMSVEDCLVQFKELIPEIVSYKPSDVVYQFCGRAFRKRCPNLRRYYELLSNDQDELDEARENITFVGSHFFRGQAWPELKERCCESFSSPEKERIRDWCAGCSNGKEVYSVLMMLADIMPLWKIELLATDYNQEMLRLCKDGVYSLRTIDEIPARYLKWTEKHKTEKNPHSDLSRLYQFRFTDQLRDKVVTSHLNLLTDDYPGGFDLILCRNVIKYFEQETRGEVQKRLVDALNPGGIIFVSDGLDSEGFRDPDSLGLRQVRETCIYTKTALK